MSLDSSATDADVAIYDDRPVECSIEHNAEQTFVTIDTQDGQVVAAVDIGHLTLPAALELARDVREAVEDATTTGGREDGA